MLTYSLRETMAVGISHGMNESAWIWSGKLFKLCCQSTSRRLVYVTCAFQLWYIILVSHRRSLDNIPSSCICDGPRLHVVRTYSLLYPLLKLYHTIGDFSLQNLQNNFFHCVFILMFQAKKLKHCSVIIGCWDTLWNVHLLCRCTLEWMFQYVINPHVFSWQKMLNINFLFDAT